MTARTIVEGWRRTEGTVLTTTAQTTVFTAIADTGQAILGINIVNTGGSPLDIEVVYNDGTSDFEFVDDANVAANDRAQYEFPLFFNGAGSIKMTAGTANVAEVLISYVEMAGRNR